MLQPSKIDRFTESELHWLLKHDFKVHPSILSGMSKQGMVSLLKALLKAKAKIK